jgi:hypothetical protein
MAIVVYGHRPSGRRQSRRRSALARSEGSHEVAHHRHPYQREAAESGYECDALQRVSYSS